MCAVHVVKLNLHTTPNLSVIYVTYDLRSSSGEVKPSHRTLAQC